MLSICESTTLTTIKKMEQGEEDGQEQETTQVPFLSAKNRKMRVQIKDSAKLDQRSEQPFSVR